MKNLIGIVLCLSLITRGQAQLQYNQTSGIIYDNAEKDPLPSSYGGDFRTTYCVFTPGTQNSDEGGNWNTPYSGAYLARTNKYARKGSYAYTAYLALNDRRFQNLKYARAELGWLSPSQQNAANEWNYAAISTLVDPATQLPNNIRYQIAYDHKESPDNRETPFWLGIKNGNYIIAGLQVGNEVNLGPVTKGVWEDWVLHRDWLQNGFINFYRNGKLVWSKRGDMRVNSYIARIQHGPYCWARNKADWAGEGSPNAADMAPIIVHYDEIRFGLKSGDATLNDFFLENSTTTNPPVVTPPVTTPPVIIPAPVPVNTDTTFSTIAGSSSDRGFVGGTPYSVGTSTERFGTFSYNIPLKNGKYKVQLGFSEIFFSAAGARTFNVSIEGKHVLSNYDIFSRAGGKNKSITESFEVTLIDGTLNINFNSVKDYAKVSSIGISPAAVIAPPVVIPPPVDTKIRITAVVEGTQEITIGSGTNTLKKNVKTATITWSDGTKSIIIEK
jgi:hypothetical protein